MKSKKLSRGFLLVELLVTLGIIGLLVSVLVVSVSSFRAKGNDAKRVRDMQEIKFGLEQYFDGVGHYPIAQQDNWASFDSVYWHARILTPDAPSLTAALSSYMKPVADPLNLGGDSGYLYTSTANGSDYCILFWETPQNMKNFPTSMWSANRCGTVNSLGQCSSGNNSVWVGTGVWGTTSC